MLVVRWLLPVVCGLLVIVDWLSLAVWCLVFWWLAFGDVHVWRLVCVFRRLRCGDCCLLFAACGYVYIVCLVCVWLADCCYVLSVVWCMMCVACCLVFAVCCL